MGRGRGGSVFEGRGIPAHRVQQLFSTPCSHPMQPPRSWAICHSHPTAVNQHWLTQRSPEHVAPPCLILQICPAEIARVTAAGGCILWGRVQVGVGSVGGVHAMALVGGSLLQGSVAIIHALPCVTPMLSPPLALRAAWRSRVPLATARCSLT